MPEIRNPDGSIHSTSRNLRGIRAHVGKHLIRVMSIDAIGERGHEGKLLILFDDGKSYETNFASFEVLREFVSGWKNCYGAPIRVNGRDHGTLDARTLHPVNLLDEFTTAYVEAALWSSMTDAGYPIDRDHGREDIATPTLLEMIRDCRRFQRENANDIEGNHSQAGHDFWLTRNRHGAGFWDGDWADEVGERLTTAAHAYGEYHLSTNRGRVYGSAG